MIETTRNEPGFALDGARLDGLELILSGLVDPIDGYCLPGQKPDEWPYESTLELSAHLASAATEAGGLVLTDPDGTPLARLGIAGSVLVGETGHAAGRLSRLQRPEHPPARHIRLSRSDTVDSSTVAIFSTEPDPAEIARAITQAAGSPLVLLAVGWNGGHTDYRISATIDSLRRCSEQVPGSIVRFLALAPLSPMAQPKRTLAHVLENLHQRTVLDYSKFEQPGTDISSSVTEGCVVLFTGLSGSGKSTIARALSERLTTGGGYRPVLLDGDDVRRVLSSGLGFTAKDREENLRRIGWVAAKIASVGGIAICAPIAPFERTRQEMRAMATGRFILVHVATPIEVCEQRDRKGLYARARAGEIKDFTGIDSPYEVPTDADLVIDTSTSSVESDVSTLLRIISGSQPS